MWWHYSTAIAAWLSIASCVIVIALAIVAVIAIVIVNTVAVIITAVDTSRY